MTVNNCPIENVDHVLKWGKENQTAEITKITKNNKPESHRTEDVGGESETTDTK